MIEDRGSWSGYQCPSTCHINIIAANKISIAANPKKNSNGLGMTKKNLTYDKL